MEKCSVMIDAWEIQCCGERFKCGEFVKWRVERFDKAMESYPEAGVIDYYYENHPTKTSGYYVLTGVVADIEVLFTHLVPDSSKAGKWLKRSDSYKKPVAVFVNTKIQRLASKKYSTSQHRVLHEF